MQEPSDAVKNAVAREIITGQAWAKLDLTHKDVLEAFRLLLNAFMDVGEFTANELQDKLMEVLVHPDEWRR